jgi:hypothetical protein
MIVETHALAIKYDVAQPITFKFTPRFCLGLFPSGAGLALKFLVDPTVPGKTCNVWLHNMNSSNIQGAPLPNFLPNAGQEFATSDCFG